MSCGVCVCQVVDWTYVANSDPVFLQVTPPGLPPPLPTLYTTTLICFVM